MADNPEVPGPNKNENDCPQLTGNAPQKNCLTPSTPDDQHPDQFDKAGMNLVVPSVTAPTADSSGECSSSAQLSTHDIDHLIGSCDLKSEEITSLMAERLPSSESEDNYGSYATLNSETKDIQTDLMEDTSTSNSEIAAKPKLDLDTMKAWLADVSDESAMSSCREPLIPLDGESDMEEFGDMKGNPESTKFDIGKKESFVNDLIILNESQEKILEPVPNQTTAANDNLLDIAVGSSPNQTAVANESLLDIVVGSPPNKTALADKSLMDIEVESATNHAAVANKSLVDMEIEQAPKQTDAANKSLLDIELDVSAAERNQDSNIETKKIARAYIELIKDTLSLNTVFEKSKKLDTLQTTAGTEAASQNGFQTLDEELRANTVPNFQKRKAARAIAEIGFPKVNVSDAERVMKDKNFKENCKIVAVTSFIEPSVTGDNLFQSVKADEELKEPVHGTDSDGYVDEVSINDSATMNNNEENTLNNNIATEMESKDSTEIDNTSKSLKDQGMMKKILKKRVTFADKKGEPGMEHMALHQEETPKILETQFDIETSLRFLTESYPSHDEEETLSESLSATLEPNALPRRRRGSPRVGRLTEDPQKLYEELMTLEGDEQPNTLSISPSQSPERSELTDSTTKNNKNSTNKPNSKFSKFFKCVRKKIFS